MRVKRAIKIEIAKGTAQQTESVQSGQIYSSTPAESIQRNATLIGLARSVNASNTINRMIASLEGTIQSLGEQHVVLVVNGVGYRVFATPSTSSTATVGASIALYTHLYVRENALELYGFVRPEELATFGILISVSGVGPKTALGILSITSPEQLRSAVVSGNVGLLTKVSGIGKKTAERLMVELKDTFTADAKRHGGQTAPTIYEGDIEVIEALEQLGYSLSDARKAVEGLPKDLTDTEGRLKAALRQLGRKS